MISVFLAATAGKLCAQVTQPYELTLPTAKVPGSLYNKIQLIDLRADTGNLGIVQLGAFNRKAKVVPKRPLADQFTDLLKAITDVDAAQGQLLLQLRQFSFAEITGAMSEKGYCYIRAGLYAHTADSYRQLARLDTVILVKSMDVTNALLRKGSETLGGFIAANIIKRPEGATVYSYQDILRADSLEKRQIKLFTTSTYTDGLYTTYQSFMSQTPDQQIVVDGTVSSKSVKAIDEEGKPQKIQAQNAYAIVYKGAPYVITKYDYYPLTKSGDDFLFTGRAKVTANAGDVITASIFFGMIGSLIASNADATFDMKIDHVNGGFIRLKEIKEPKVAMDQE